MACVTALAAVAIAPELHLQAQREFSFYVNAVDKTGAPVLSLNPEDVRVTEDKAEREVIRVVPATDPMELAILIDNSQAAEPYIRDYREAVPAFIRALGEDESGARHQVAVVTIGERPTINTDYSIILSQPIAGAGRIFSTPGSGAYLLDGIMEISKGLAKRQPLRPVIVAISTEGPELSGRHYLQALEPLRASGAMFYVITIGRPDGDDEDRAMTIEIGTKDSGGKRLTTFTSNGLKVRLAEVARELTHQYRVVYARPQSLLAPSKMAVAAKKPGLTVRGTAVLTPRER